MKQIHKKFSNEQVKAILEKYEKSIFKRQITERLLGIKLSQFFNLLRGLMYNIKLPSRMEHLVLLYDFFFIEMSINLSCCN